MLKFLSCLFPVEYRSQSQQLEILQDGPDAQCGVQVCGARVHGVLVVGHHDVEAGAATILVDLVDFPVDETLQTAQRDLLSPTHVISRRLMNAGDGVKSSKSLFFTMGLMLGDFIAELSISNGDHE